MKKVNLKEAVQEFQMISDQIRVFYNTQTGEFDLITDFYGYIDDEDEDEDREKFDAEEWIQGPDRYDINAYGMMCDFTNSVSDPRKGELLAVALEGRGAFRRFRDTLSRVELWDEWNEFENDAYMEVVKRWCAEQDLEWQDEDHPGSPFGAATAPGGNSG